jgi:hypothetical protein
LHLVTIEEFVKDVDAGWEGLETKPDVVPNEQTFFTVDEVLDNLDDLAHMSRFAQRSSKLAMQQAL